MNQLNINKKYREVIMKGNFIQINEDYFVLEQAILGGLTVVIYDDWVHTQLEDVEIGSAFLQSWEGNLHTGKCNFHEEDEAIRFKVFKSFISDFINYKG